MRAVTFDGTTWTQAGIPVVRATCALDLDSAAGFEAALVPHLTQGPGAVADLGQVPFMDSWGLAALMRGHLAGGAHGSRLAVLPSEQVRHVLDAAGLLGVLYITSSVDAGCDEVRRGGVSDR